VVNGALQQRRRERFTILHARDAVKLMPQIRVHEKALAHLSRGLYRSPASALRELVSNAWDANATHVMIATNYPSFVQIAVRDNGDGFSRDEFRRLMSGGIGNSEKREADAPLIHNRPMIGRLGIGLLGIAQICGGFEVASKPKGGEAFRARVRLYDLIREKLDSKDPSIVKDELSVGVREVDVGEYDFLDQTKVYQLVEHGLPRTTFIQPSFGHSENHFKPRNLRSRIETGQSV
jgi:Histidine kinase-, DNA gyrase B-, and HSP90-like ATPase